jgi:predicted RNA binding protein YcfA (HicA-like mRNA interferase family)
LKLPRDLSGEEFAQSLRRYGYTVTRQTGSHMRLSSSVKGAEHHITVPAHKHLKIGTLAGILSNVAQYLEISREDLARKLFDR